MEAQARLSAGHFHRTGARFLTVAPSRINRAQLVASCGGGKAGPSSLLLAAAFLEWLAEQLDHGFVALVPKDV